MIDTKIITKLRELTGAGIGDCKSALEESSGDLDKAVEVLRKKGAVKAAKKADRTTSEGVIALAKGENKIAIFGLACETDFVSQNEDFIKTVQALAQKLLTTPLEEFKALTDSQIKNELVVKIGENIQLGPCEVVTGQILGSYLHSNKKLASVVVLSSGSVELGNELAMQVAAMFPRFLKPEDVPADVLEKEKEIHYEQLKNEGKPENMWEKIIPGKLNKFYQDVCLTKQLYIKDDKLTIEQLLKQQNGEVVSFGRYQI